MASQSRSLLLSPIAPTHDKPPSLPATILKFKNPALSLLELCNSMKELKQLHAHLIISGTAHQILPLSRLIAFAALAPRGDLGYARLLFDRSSAPPNIFIWSTMIRAYSRSTSPQMGIEFYRIMLERGGVIPENYTAPFALNACSAAGAADEGRAVHGQVLKLGLDSNEFVQNALVKLYLSVGDHGSARQVFDGISEPSEVAWDMLIDWYGKAGEVEVAHQLFVKMPQRGLIAWNSIVGGYALCGLLDTASMLFDEMPHKNVSSWNTLIGGHLIHGEFAEALLVFNKMQREGGKPDKVTLALVLSACGELGAFEQGRWLHNHIKENEIEMNVFLGTSLIHMYAKTGFIDCACEIFKEMPDKDVLAWNAMIGSYAMHGLGNEVLKLFAEMELAGIVPNEITFLGVLSACCHAGLVEEGIRHFNSMTNLYNIKATNKHFACMVDLFGRAGMLKEAEELIHCMPEKPGGSVWGALLGASKIHGNVDIGEEAGKHAIELEPYNDGRYVVLSNLYAASGNWEKSSNVRRLMKEKGVKKTPGCSLIEVDGLVHEFLVGDEVHPQRQEIYSMLSMLNEGMKSFGNTRSREVLVNS